jgi:hypothetical protein
VGEHREEGGGRGRKKEREKEERERLTMKKGMHPLMM